MTKSKTKQSDTTNQLSIFDILQSKAREAATHDAKQHAGSMDFRSELCAALAQDIKHAHDEQGRELSRYEVAARISHLLNYEVSKSTLDNWTACSHEGRTPDAVEVATFVRATGGERRAIECVSRHAGIFALPGPDALRAEIRKREEIVERERREIQRSKTLLSELERRR